jgi:hypothetical protein
VRSWCWLQRASCHLEKGPAVAVFLEKTQSLASPGTPVLYKRDKFRRHGAPR